jgi:glutaminyl-tRNA synthetase
MSDTSAGRPLNFIEEIVEADNASGTWGHWPASDPQSPGLPRVHTRFPPEPNGYLHVGHAKSILLNYGLASRYGGKFNLRFDDTNPVKEEQEYVDSIIEDVRWLGARWPGARDDDPHAGVLFASDYFPQMYAWAVELVKKGKAYVCDCTPERVRQLRGPLTRPGENCPHRGRSSEENADLLERMRAGEFPDGSRVLRAKIDMASPNMNLRDPVMYRVLHADHHRTGSTWRLYPMYDWAHGFEDSIEGITHSICTLEFENHRPLYNWFIDAVNEGRTPDGSGPWGRTIHHPRQIEFARFNLNYTVMSKRKLLHLVKGGHVSGWDDPRMPTISGMRRRGYTPEAIRDLCERVGVAKFNGVTDAALLEACVREHLNSTAPRVLAVLRPLKLVIENWPGDSTDWLEAVNNPEDPAAGSRKVPCTRELYIEREDFMETPPPKYWRLYPGNEVRLRYAFFVKCTGFSRDSRGEISEVRCTYDPATRGGDAPGGRKVKSTLHWVSAAHALPCEVRLYDRLFRSPDPEAASESGEAAGENAWLANINPNSLETVTARVEPSVADAARGARYQFERHGYFCVDPDSTPAGPGRKLVFNRTVSLKDSWAREKAK